MDNNQNYMHIQDVRILDIYGSEDRKLIHDAVKKRAHLANELHKAQYQQVIVSGANHFYQGKQEELVKVLDKMLSRNN